MVIDYIKNLLYFPFVFFSILSDLRRQKRFIKKELKPVLDEAIKTNDGSLDSEDFKKIREYYANAVPAILGEAFCTLRGEKMSWKERNASTYQGALTGLFDDFFDKRNLSEKHIREMMDFPDKYNPGNSNEELFVNFLTRVIDNLSNYIFFKEAFDKVFTAQVESLKQKNKNINKNEIIEISFAKGGYSVLYYRSVFSNIMLKKENEAIYNLGALAQLGNDIFDVYKDHKQNIRTLVTTSKNINEVREVFIKQISLTFEMFKKLDYKKKNINFFLRKMYLGIFCRCMVCLDQLEVLQTKTDNAFTPDEYSRKDMICDMEKPVNIFRAIYYFIKMRY